jgi:hypothetical protein
MAEDPELGLFLRLAVVLGARRGEVLIVGSVVRVPKKALVHKDTKTHAKRRVAVGAGTVELLRARRVAQAKDALACGTTLAADAYVFSHVPDGSKPIDPDGISHRFQRLARASACAAASMTCATSWSPSWSPVGWTGAPSRAGLGTPTGI